MAESEERGIGQKAELMGVQLQNLWDGNTTLQRACLKEAWLRLIGVVGRL